VKSSADLRAATFELTAEPPLTTDIVFHSLLSRLPPEVEP